MVEAFLISLGAVFVAELGDKSQLMALTFAARYRAWVVLLGVSVATLLVHAGSVLLGVTITAAIPTQVIQLAGSIVFFAFAAWTIRGDSLDPTRRRGPSASSGWAVLAVGSAFFLAELGDKTMLVTVTLATTAEPWGTWLDSTVSMVAADAIAIAVGSLLGSRLPERSIKIFASAMFTIFGVLLVAEGLGIRLPA